MWMFEQYVAVGCRQRADLPGRRAQLLLVAVGRLAVGDVEDHGREALRILGPEHPLRGQVADAAQRLAHRRLPLGPGFEPAGRGYFAQRDAAVGQPVFEPLGADAGLHGRQFADGVHRGPVGQQRRHLVVTEVAQHGDVVVVAYAVAAARPLDELEEQFVGDGGHHLALGLAAAAEVNRLGHRAGAVDGQEEGRAVAARDALRIHGSLSGFSFFCLGRRRIRLSR